MPLIRIHHLRPEAIPPASLPDHLTVQFSGGNSINSTLLAPGEIAYARLAPQRFGPSDSSNPASARSLQQRSNSVTTTAG